MALAKKITRAVAERRAAEREAWAAIEDAQLAKEVALEYPDPESDPILAKAQSYRWTQPRSHKIKQVF